MTIMSRSDSAAPSMSLPSQHADYVTALSFDYYGRRIASCSADRTISVFDLDDHGQWLLGNTISAAHYTGVSGVSWAHPEFGQLLCSAGNDGMAVLWEEKTEEFVTADTVQPAVYHSRWVERARLTDARRALSCVRFAPRHVGLVLATGSADGFVRIYEAVDAINLSQWLLKNTVEVAPTVAATSAAETSGTELGVTCLDFCTGRFEAPSFVVGSAQGAVQIYTLSDTSRSWTLTHSLEPHTSHNGLRRGVLDVAWAPNVGRSFHLIASCGRDGILRVSKLKRIRKQEDSTIDAMDTAGTDKSRPIIGYDFESSQVLETPGGEVWKCAWNITGTVLAASGDLGKVSLWKSDYMNQFKCVSEREGYQYYSEIQSKLTAAFHLVHEQMMDQSRRKWKAKIREIQTRNSTEKQELRHHTWVQRRTMPPLESIDRSDKQKEPNLIELISDDSITYSFHDHVTRPTSSESDLYPYPTKPPVGETSKSDQSLLHLLNEDVQPQSSNQHYADHTLPSMSPSLVHLTQKGIAFFLALSQSEWETLLLKNSILDVDSITSLLKQVSLRQVILTTLDLNLILIHISLSAPNSHKLELLLHLFKLMEELDMPESVPNEDTYVLLLTSIHNMANASHVALQIASKMITKVKERSIDLNRDLVQISMAIFRSRSERRYAEELFKLVLSSEQGLEIFHRDIYPLLAIYKEEYLKDQLLETIKILILEWKDHQDFESKISRLLLYCIPSLPKRHKVIPGESTLKYFNDIMDVFQTSGYIPPLNVWNKILVSIYSINNIQNKDEQQLLTLQKCCHGLLQVVSTDMRDIHQIIKIGIETAEAMDDPQLALSILLWSASKGETNNTQSIQPEISTVQNKDQEQTIIHLPPELVLRSMKLCVQHGHADLTEQIWTQVDDMLHTHTWPKSIQSDFHTMRLIGYAKAGQVAKAETLLEQMRQQGILLSESPYAAVILALHEGGYSDKANELLGNMERNVYGDNIQPNSECFRFSMLSALKLEAWEHVIEYCKLMTKAGISLDHSSTLCVLLASSHSGQDKLLTQLQTLLSTKAQFNIESFYLCLENLFPSMFPSRTELMSIDRIRVIIRSMGENMPHVREESVRLIRSLRNAEIEDSRKPTRQLGFKDITSSRDELWRHVMVDLFNLTSTYRGLSNVHKSFTDY